MPRWRQPHAGASGSPAWARPGPVHRGPSRNVRTAQAVEPGVIVREALPDEFAVIGDLRVAAYRADGFLSETSAYAATLHALGSDGAGDVLVAVDGGQMLGTVMLQYWPQAGNVVRGPGEAEIRALAVAPGARGRGIGRALVAAIMERAIHRQVRHSRRCAPPSVCTLRPDSAACPIVTGHRSRGRSCSRTS